jgi:hypothetical protein
MARKLLIRIGAGLAVAGLLAALGALALPWGHYRVVGRRTIAGDVRRAGDMSVFDAPGGLWFVVVLLLLAGLVAVAAFGVGRARQVAGLTAPVIGLVAAVLVVTTVSGMTGTNNSVALGIGEVSATVRAGVGGWFAVAAAALLCFGGGLLSLGRSDR